jgi:hypothetical protein
MPDQVAKILTYPERVTTVKTNLMRQLILNGTNVHRSANSTTKGQRLQKVLGLLQSG